MPNSETMGKGRFIITLSDASRAHPVCRRRWELASDNFPHYDGPAWKVRYRRLHGGMQEGVEVVDIDNGRMTLTVVPSRGMNILEARCDGIRLGWDSPVKQVVHPHWICEEARGGTGWLEGFNELVSRCGPENTGAPGMDCVEDESGRKEHFLTLHGSASNTPASKLWFCFEQSPPYRLSAGGEVRFERMFGPSYLLTTEISTLPGAPEFHIQDEVVNTGGMPGELELLYHCNFGPPVLGPGSRLIAPVRKLAPRDAAAASGIDQWDVFCPPSPGFQEQCFYFTLHGDEKGCGTVALVEPGGEYAARLSFPLADLPAFTLWKNTADMADGYVTGLEPGTGYPNHRSFEREKGRVVSLQAGRSRSASLTLGLETGRENVEALCSGISRLSGGMTGVCRTADTELSPP